MHIYDLNSSAPEGQYGNGNEPGNYGESAKASGTGNSEVKSAVRSAETEKEKEKTEPGKAGSDEGASDRTKDDEPSGGQSGKSEGALTQKGGNEHSGGQPETDQDASGRTKDDDHSEKQSGKDAGEKQENDEASSEKEAGEASHGEQKEKSAAEEGSPAKQEPSATEGSDQEEESPAEENAAGEEGSQSDEEYPAREADYQQMEKEELVRVMEDMLATGKVNDIKEDVEVVRVNFYKKHKAEIEKKRKKFLIEGGKPEDFMPGEDPLEQKFKELYADFRKKKASYNKEMEDQKRKNLQEKYKVIDELKHLIESSEDINKDFQKFRELQKRWRSIGMVPQQNLKDLWNTYHHYVELFYDQVKINKELRDLDMKKNLEAKLQLCEKAEELLFEPSIINAFKTLQKYHDQWREIGPVPRDQKDVIWERFREVTYKINKKHQAYFEEKKEERKKNLEAKKALCEKAEAINARPMDNLKDAEKSTREMIELQKAWKTIGFAPKKENNKVYQRFKKTCDEFFARKREFNSQNKEYLNENYQKKLELCVQAEELKDSTDWKKTTDELIALQKKWKQIGPVPKKHYDAIWKRFRAACDHFFNRKSEHFANKNQIYEENLRKKNELIEKIENFQPGDDVDENLRALKDFQREWSKIGFVPIKQKDEVQKRYREALNRHFENLNMDDHKKKLLKYKNKLEDIKQKPNASQKLSFEREKFMNKLKQLENDLVVWENNIGFFTKSENAEPMIKEFRDKIEKGKKQVQLLEEKIKMIDKMDY